MFGPLPIVGYPVDLKITLTIIKTVGINQTVLVGQNPDMSLYQLQTQPRADVVTITRISCTSLNFLTPLQALVGMES